MIPSVQLTREDLDVLLSEHRRLIQLTNELEYCLYRVGSPDEPAVRDCQEAAGTLIGCLRDHLFRHDQQVLPALEALVLTPAPRLSGPA
jgi:hemerythrin-like domain-containing protein